MYYLPHTTFEIKTELSKEEVLQRISSVLSGKSFFVNYFKRDGKIFKGTVEKDSFQISRIITHQNSWNPIISGEVIENSRGSIVKVEMNLSLGVRIFSIFWICFMLLMSFFSYSSYEDLYEPAGMIATLYVITFFAFNIAAEKAKIAIIKVVKK